MDRWAGRVAVVTGASSGIGAAIAKDLAKAGMTVVGLARRVQLIEELKAVLPENDRKNLLAIKCDLSKDEEIKKSFEWIETNLGGVDVLVNNAGIAIFGSLLDPQMSENIRKMIDINLMALISCTREAVQSMLRRSFDGHIIHMNSILGHKSLPWTKDDVCTNVYSPAKYAITALTEEYRKEFNIINSKIKVTSISPGFVRTEILPEGFKDIAMLEPEDISQAVLYILGTPPHVQIHDLIIKPIGETM